MITFEGAVPIHTKANKQFSVVLGNVVVARDHSINAPHDYSENGDEVKDEDGEEIDKDQDATEEHGNDPDIEYIYVQISRGFRVSYKILQSFNPFKTAVNKRLEAS